MQVTAAAVLLSLAAGLGLMATQPEKTGGQPTTQPGAAAPGKDTSMTNTESGGAQPGKAEAPDGTMLDIVQTSSICLLMEDLKVGTGPEAKPSSTIKINYHGTLKNGKVFDSTRGKAPIEFPLSNLIKGWQMGIPGMKVGGVRRLTIPWQLAYGEQEIPDRQNGGVLIPARSDLVFSIELLGVK
ncbi:MAG: FKBP-type peptidyl-prolyl cis-trans isomerase [Planctomycetota bacterium]|nr:FKBP-type peptidyl-prolyl cis-trans isomerase [Planctomycetota bacterium]